MNISFDTSHWDSIDIAINDIENNEEKVKKDSDFTLNDLFCCNDFILKNNEIDQFKKVLEEYNHSNNSTNTVNLSTENKRCRNAKEAIESDTFEKAFWIALKGTFDKDNIIGIFRRIKESQKITLKEYDLFQKIISSELFLERAKEAFEMVEYFWKKKWIDKLAQTITVENLKTYLIEKTTKSKISSAVNWNFTWEEMKENESFKELFNLKNISIYKEWLSHWLVKKNSEEDSEKVIKYDNVRNISKIDGIDDFLLVYLENWNYFVIDKDWNELLKDKKYRNFDISHIEKLNIILAHINDNGFFEVLDKNLKNKFKDNEVFTKISYMWDYVLLKRSDDTVMLCDKLLNPIEATNDSEYYDFHEVNKWTPHLIKGRTSTDFIRSGKYTLFIEEDGKLRELIEGGNFSEYEKVKDFHKLKMWEREILFSNDFNEKYICKKFDFSNFEKSWFISATFENGKSMEILNSKLVVVWEEDEYKYDDEKNMYYKSWFFGFIGLNKNYVIDKQSSTDNVVSTNI